MLVFTSFPFRYDDKHAVSEEKALALTSPEQDGGNSDQQLTHTMKGVIEADLSDKVISVCGILLPKLGISGSQVGQIKAN